jgi:hypothetical protein
MLGAARRLVELERLAKELAIPWDTLNQKNLLEFCIAYTMYHKACSRAGVKQIASDKTKAQLVLALQIHEGHKDLFQENDHE